MSKKVYIVGIGGTTRPGSTSEKLLAAALDKCAELGAETRMFGGAELAVLPHYAPEFPDRTEEQRQLVDAVRIADGVIVSTPGYHGGMSALVKNALDLLDDTRTDARCYLDGCPVGMIVSTAGWQAVGGTLSSMRDIICSLRGWPVPIAIGVNSMEQKPFDAEGNVADAAISNAIAGQAAQILGHLRSS